MKILCSLLLLATFASGASGAEPEKSFRVAFHSSVVLKANATDDPWSGIPYLIDSGFYPKNYLFGIHVTDVRYGGTNRVVTLLHLFGPMDLVGMKDEYVSAWGFGYNPTDHLFMQAGFSHTRYIGSSLGLRLAYR